MFTSSTKYVYITEASGHNTQENTNQSWFYIKHATERRDVYNLNLMQYAKMTMVYTSLVHYYVLASPINPLTFSLYISIKVDFRSKSIYYKFTYSS